MSLQVRSRFPPDLGKERLEDQVPTDSKDKSGFPRLHFPAANLKSHNNSKNQLSILTPRLAQLEERKTVMDLAYWHLEARGSIPRARITFCLFCLFLGLVVMLWRCFFGVGGQGTFGIRGILFWQSKHFKFVLIRPQESSVSKGTAIQSLCCER